MMTRTTNSLVAFFIRFKASLTHLWSDDDAVSDTIGSILLVGMTVASFVGLSALVLNIPAPPDPIHAEIDIKVKPGPDATWSTGDELVQIRHMYGESVPLKGTTFYIRINNDTHEYSGAMLGFSDDRLDLGERWTANHIIGFNDRVETSIVVASGSGNAILAGSSVVTGQTECSSDVKGPAAIFGQTPDNLDVQLATSPVTIEAIVTDACSAIDQGVDPVIDFWFDTEDPQSRVMAPSGTDRWSYVIDPLAEPTIVSWSNHGLRDFQYRVRGMADVLGNTGDSDVVTDLVDPLPPTYYYVEKGMAGLGAIINFPLMQNGTDNGAAAQLTEATTSENQTNIQTFGEALSMVDPFPANHEEWKDEDRILGDEDNEAKYQEDPHPSNYPMRIEMADPTTTLEKVVAVKVGVQGQIDSDDPIDDGWRLQICWTGEPITGATCSVKSPTLPATEATQWHEYDFTNFRPGGGTWTVADLANVDIVLEGVVVGGIRDGDWEAQRVRLNVTVGPGYDMDHEFRWENNTIAPSTNTLEMRYWASGGAFEVLVWDGSSSYVKKGADLAAATATQWSVSLTNAEWANGNPRVIIQSLTSQPASQAKLHVDYMRVTSA